MGAGGFSSSVPTLPAAISRSAITVDLSRFGSTSGVRAVRELARAVGRGERELEAVGDELEAIVNGDAGHGAFSSYLNSSMSFWRRTACWARAQPGRAHDGLQVRQRRLEVFFVNYIFELRTCEISSRALARRCAITSGASWPRACEAAPQLRDRGRQDEDADHVGEELAHLLRALPVDLEHQVVAAVERCSIQRLRGAVAVAVHLGALEELARSSIATNVARVDEVVLAAVDLARARRARGVGDRQLESRVALRAAR